ncbi:MAG: hypothetical protein EOO28_16610 [Comamonadaceae bacterium]|nr:MAG: hypothetical protein EOO28_16610 [Comamonadaceae bacterium]
MKTETNASPGNDGELVRVTAIKVTKLFGIYTHFVQLKGDRVTVIHGPNGVGKTVFLKLVNAFFHGRYSEFARLHFDSFEILFSDQSSAKLLSILLENSKKGDRATLPRAFQLIFTKSDGSTQESVLEGEILDASRLAATIASEVPYVSQLGPDQWIDRRTDEVFSDDEVVDRYAESIPPKLRNKLSSKEPSALRLLRNKTKSHFIEAQRLIRLAPQGPDWRYRASGPERMVVETVREYSTDLKRRVEQTLTAYAKQSQKLDQSFPQRLIEGASPPLPLAMLKAQMADVESARARLKKIGLLEGDDSAQYPFQTSQLDGLQENQIFVMSVYASDTRAKLAVLDDLALRIEILLNIVNRKFTNKKIRVSRESGLLVHGADGGKIPLTSLSSGEQHEIVLLYDLLFKVSKNTLVLIDEPELSLHVTWQKNFMEDLLEIIHIAKFDALIATHSPYIVGDRSDLMVVLSSEASAITPQ